MQISVNNLTNQVISGEDLNDSSGRSPKGPKWVQKTLHQFHFTPFLSPFWAIFYLYLQISITKWYTFQLQSTNSCTLLRLVIPLSGKNTSLFQTWKTCYTTWLHIFFVSPTVNLFFSFLKSVVFAHVSM